MNKSLNITPEQFLSAFFDPGDVVCPRVFSDRKDAGSTGSTFKGQKYQCEIGKFDSLIESLHKHNAQHRGIFFTVNSGGHEDGEITRINAQFVEMDTATFEKQWERVESFKLPPSLVVKTAKSLHCYWLMKNADVSKFRSIQKRLVAQFDGDPACVNESRVMRIPGFHHCKGEPIMVECVKFAPEVRYTQAELEAVLPKAADEPAAPPGKAPQGSRKGLTLVGKRCAFIQHCKENASTLPENLWYAMITNLAVFEGGDKAIHALSKGFEKYSYTETDGKIRHFLESGTKPMTCAKIAEFGFTCPHTASCGCKAPAALCYKAMTTEELREALANCEVRSIVLDDMQTARQYITEYLYNVDSVLAEAFINYELKPHFGFKSGDMKPLISLHKDIHKKHTDSKETRRETEGTELPDWYEITERGGLHFLPGVLADHMAKNVSAFYGAGAYYFYRHGVYELDDEDSAKNAVRDLMIARQAKATDIGDACTQWRIQIKKAVREINANPFIVNLRNGLYNVLDGTFKEHSPAYYSTVQLNANYDPTAKCPQFLDFLRGILPESELPLIQEIFGYLLIPVNKAQKAFVFVGAPNAGKSTLLSIAQEVLLGAENVTNIPWQSLGDRFYKAELFGKLANVFADLPSKNIEDGGWFKALTGEDYISAERKNKDPFNYRPYARLLFSCNDIPKNYADRSDGFYRRLLIIRFEKSVPMGKRDPNLRERIAVERDGILVWALEGLKRLIAGSYIFSETQRTRSEVARYRIESNSVLTFVDEMCEVADGHWIAREELYTRYKDFCAANGLRSSSQTNFNREIESNFTDVHRGQDKVSGRKVWRGLAFVEGGKE